MIADIITKIASDEEAEKSREDPERGKFYPRPSLAGPDRCIRQLVYWGLEFPREPFPGRTLLVFDDGHWHEELTADWIRKSPFRLHSEQMEVEAPYPMSKGHIDGILTDLLGNDYLWEHKAINHFTFQKFWNDDEVPLDYFSQVAIYLWGLQKVNPAIIHCLLLIKNKNTAQYMEYLLRYESLPDTLGLIEKVNSQGERKSYSGVRFPFIVNDAVQKFANVKAYIADRMLPKRPYEMDNWRCAYCSWGKTCWDGYEREFKELKTAAMLPEEVAGMMRYYKELGAQKSDIEDEYKKLAGQIKQTMKDADAREGRAGEYIAKISLVKQQRLDKSLLSQNEIKKATVESMYERLYVSSPKGRSNSNDDVHSADQQG